MNILEVLKETAADSKLPLGVESLPDEEVIFLLKMNIVKKMSQDSYEKWIKEFSSPIKTKTGVEK